MIVIGIDPGAATTGYGVVARSGDGAVSLIECGVVRTWWPRFYQVGALPQSPFAHKVLRTSLARLVGNNAING